MTVSKDPNKVTVKDLSSLPENQSFPAYHSSMAGGNMTTTKNPHFAGQGTDSEATHDVVAGNVDWVGNIQNVPVLPGPDAVGDSHLSTDEKGSNGHDSAIHPWKEI
jgi:hypothetical protein